MSHEPCLTHALRALFANQRVAALGTLDEKGLPFVSMVPFAVDNSKGVLVIHVSALAAHTRNLQTSPRVSLLIMQAEVASEAVHALPRVTLDGKAAVLVPQTAEWQSARTAYLTRFPEAEPMTQLGDFMFVAIELNGARQVAGFGAARSVEPQEILLALQ